MRSRVSCSTGLFLFLSASLAAAADAADQAATCAGNACAALSFDAATCTMKNVGAGDVKVEFKDVYTLTIPVAAGGQVKAEKPFGGCFNPKNMGEYKVNYVGAPPKGADTRQGAAIAREMGFADPHACSGDACGAVSYAVEGACVWLKNEGSSTVKAEVSAGAKTVALELKPAKSEAELAAKQSARQPTKRCLNAWRLEDSLQAMRARGVELDGPPDHGQALLECGAKPTDEPAKAEDAQGKYVQKYEPFSGRTTAHYWAKVVVDGACVAALSGVGPFTANKK